MNIKYLPIAICCSFFLALPAESRVLQEFGYDARGRLAWACEAPPHAGFLTTYNFDRVDNRTSVHTANQTIILPPGTEIRSADGRFIFTMQQDGNLVLYGPNGALWHTSTYGSPGAFAAFQGDGNLVVYKGDGTGSLWSSGTHSPCARLAVQNDGNVVIYSPAGPSVWATNTVGQ